MPSSWPGLGLGQDALRFHALLIGMLCGYALGRWVGLCGPAGECLTWGMLAPAGGGEVLAHQVAEILLDDEGAERERGGGCKG